MRFARALLPLLLFSALPATAATFDAKLTAFDEQLVKLRKEHPLPGLSVAIVKDGELVWSKAYGCSSVDEEVAMTTDTPMWIASVTKPLIATLFLKLASTNAISLDDDINSVPEWDDLCGWLNGSPLPFGKDLRCKEKITIRDILQHRVNGKPGEQFLYNPIVFSRLSRYIETKYGGNVRHVEGRQNKMAQLLEEQVLAPAGMKRTMSSMWQRERQDVYFDLAQGYGADDGNWVRRRRPNRNLAGGAGVVSTVLDLARFDIALDSGRILKDPSIMFTPPSRPDGTPSPYAYGWYVQHYRGERLLWHSGWDEEAGYSAIYLKVPSRRLTFIALANGEGLWWNNPLDAAQIDKSDFAKAFLDTFVD